MALVMPAGYFAVAHLPASFRYLRNCTTPAAVSSHRIAS